MFHSSIFFFFFFLPEQPSGELPTVFIRKPPSDPLDLGAWPDRRPSLPNTTSHPSESLAHGVGVFILPQHVKKCKAGFFSFLFFFPAGKTPVSGCSVLSRFNIMQTASRQTE